MLHNRLQTTSYGTFKSNTESLSNLFSTRYLSLPTHIQNLPHFNAAAYYSTLTALRDWPKIKIGEMGATPKSFEISLLIEVSQNKSSYFI